MKATGIVRRIDDLGRVVIPKEIRRTLRIREADPLEIFTDREGEIILKKYSPIGELGNFAKEYAEALASASGHSVCITDRDQVIAAAGGIKKDTIGTPVTGQLEEVMNERENVLLDQQHTPPVKITSEDPDTSLPMVISPSSAREMSSAPSSSAARTAAVKWARRNRCWQNAPQDSWGGRWNSKNQAGISLFL